MKKLLITGSVGFIFSNFVRKAIYEKQPYQIISLDRVSKPSFLNNIYQNKNHKFHIGDITDEHFINTIFEYERPDIVVHGAAESAVDESLKDPNKFIKSNVLGTQILVNAAVKYGVERFVYISSDEYYGQLESKDDLPWTEDSPPNPRNPYAASKTAAEFVVKAAHLSHGLQYNITRSSNNYGPRQTPDKLMPRVIKCILNGDKIPVYGQGLQYRDWTFVNDNCDAIMTIINSGKLNEAYNISANEEHTNIDVVTRICKIMGNNSEQLISYIEDPRKSHDFRYAIDCSKLKGLGWEPKISFDEGLKQCIFWFQNNPWFLKL